MIEWFGCVERTNISTLTARVYRDTVDGGSGRGNLDVHTSNGFGMSLK